jgi:hypothetical protein
VWESKEVALPSGVGGALKLALDDDGKSAALKIKSSKVGLIAGELSGEGWRSDNRAQLKGVKGAVKADLNVKRVDDGGAVSAVLTLRVNALEIPLSFRLLPTDGGGDDDDGDDGKSKGGLHRLADWIGNNPLVSAGAVGAVALAVMKLRK